MPAKKPFIPPGGFAGFASQTVAVQALLRRPTRKKRVTKKRAKKKVTRRAATRRTGTRRKKRGGRLVKGSPAAKRRMAALRKMQRRGKR